MDKLEKNAPDTLFHIKPEEWESTGAGAFPELTYRGNSKADFLKKLSMSEIRGSIKSKLDKGELSPENIQIRAKKDLEGSLRFQVSYVRYIFEATSFYEYTESFDSRGRWEGGFGENMYFGDDARTICINPEDLSK